MLFSLAVELNSFSVEISICHLRSLEKLRPEKELERAKGEILKYKLRIREVFQNLDSLLTKGKIDESLFDSEGEIACDDVWWYFIVCHQYIL